MRERKIHIKSNAGCQGIDQQNASIILSFIQKTKEKDNENKNNRKRFERKLMLLREYIQVFQNSRSK